jgi:hypothetical protein
MPLSTYGNILSPFIAVTPSYSEWGIGGATNEMAGRYMFGVVDSVSYFANAVVGQTVYFDSQGAMLAIRGVDSYYIMKEDKIMFREIYNILPPP